MGCSESDLQAEIANDERKAKEQAMKQIGRLLNLIHSDIYVKTPRGQVTEGDEIEMKRHLPLLNEADKARALMDELWDYGDSWEEWISKEEE